LAAAIATGEVMAFWRFDVDAETLRALDASVDAGAFFR
jgi:hypothetical protein